MEPVKIEIGGKIREPLVMVVKSTDKAGRMVLSGDFKHKKLLVIALDPESGDEEAVKAFDLMKQAGAEIQKAEEKVVEFGETERKRRRR